MISLEKYFLKLLICYWVFTDAPSEYSDKWYQQYPAPQLSAFAVPHVWDRQGGGLEFFFHHL